MSNIRVRQGQKRHLFIELSEESYGFLMKNQLQKSLEKIVEAENQLYKKVSKVQMKKFNVEISNMYYIKGLILDRMKDLPKSLLAYLRAFEENRKNKSICNNIGKVYLQMLNYIEAEKYLHWALQLDDKLLQAYVNLAYLYFEISDFEKCIMICLEALQRNIHDYMLHEYLGICYVIQRKNYADSLNHLKEYMHSCTKNKFKPSFLSLYYISYDLLVESKYEDALKYIQTAVNLYPQEIEALYLRSQIFYQLERLNEAEQDLLKYAQLNNIQVNIDDSQINSHLICDQDIESYESPSRLCQQSNNNNNNINQVEAESQNNFESLDSNQKDNVSGLKLKDQQLYETDQKPQNRRFPNCYVDIEQNHQKQEDQLNIYFMLGLIYMKKAYLINTNKDVDQKFHQQKIQEKAVKFFEDSKAIEYQFPIMFNLGLLFEQMGENDESYQILQRTLILHFEKSNDELYLNSDNYHTLNILLLDIYKLNYLQRYQQNLNQIIVYDETEKVQAKLSTDSKSGSNVENFDNQSHNGKYFSDVIYPRKRKISVNHIKTIKQNLSSQISRIKNIISATKEQLIEMILNKLNYLNKQKLILNEKNGQYKQTVLDQESFVSPLAPGIVTNSQIGEENLRSNIRSSYLQSCDDWNKLDEDNNQSETSECNSPTSAGSPTAPKKQPLLESKSDFSENKILSQLASASDNQDIIDLKKQMSNSKKQQQFNENQGGLQFRKLNSKKCICDQENSNTSNLTTFEMNDKKCTYCQEIHLKSQEMDDVEIQKYDDFGEDEEEKNSQLDEENEEIKLQKQRELEKEKIIKNARRVFEKQKEFHYERIQKLKLEANEKQEEEYKLEKQKLFKQIKSIQQEYDNIIQQFRSYITNNKNYFSPECLSCNPIYRTSDSSSRDDQASLKTQEESSRNSQLESNVHLSNQINTSQQFSNVSGGQQSSVSIQQNQSKISSNNETENKKKEQCKCDELKNQLLNFNSFLQTRQYERDFFFAFKRLIKNTFLHSRYIIDSLYRKNSITISSLAELSLGFIPLFQSDLLLLDKQNSQIQIISNEDLVKKCYIVISLSDSVENLHTILDSLSSALSVYLQEYICDFSYNIQENIYPDLWGMKMNQVLDLLKNNFEVSFEMMGESYAYFILYQFFAKFVESNEDLQKYKEKHLHDRAKFLFTFILNNVKFSPLEFFKAKMNPPKEIFSPTNLPPNPTRVMTNVSTASNHSCRINESSIKTYSNYCQSETLKEDPIIRKSSKKQKRDQQQKQDKCLCNIY